jgi:DNA-3-methyladenine glycosylase I
VLNKREHFRAAFYSFDIEKVAGMSAHDTLRLLGTKEIIRNRLKIESVIHNAQRIMEMKPRTTFSHYIWGFNHHNITVNHPSTMTDVPATSPVSDAMSKQMKNDGFRFVGSTICYAFMQSMGMVNDHTITCFRNTELLEM